MVPVCSLSASTRERTRACFRQRAHPCHGSTVRWVTMMLVVFPQVVSDRLCTMVAVAADGQQHDTEPFFGCAICDSRRAMLALLVDLYSTRYLYVLYHSSQHVQALIGRTRSCLRKRMRIIICLLFYCKQLITSARKPSAGAGTRDY